ncbi:hypothetical protein Tco_0635824 [Tanacetum coccineum]
MLLKRWKIDGEFIFWKRVRKVFVFITRYGSMENILSKYDCIVWSLVRLSARVRSCWIWLGYHGESLLEICRGSNILPLGTFLLDLFILGKDGLFIQFDVFLKLKASPYWHKEGAMLSSMPASQ